MCDEKPVGDFTDRPPGEEEKDAIDVKLIKAQAQKDSHEREDNRKFWALIALFFGFFFAVIMDVVLTSFGKDKWVTPIFATTIVPILAFILGMDFASKNKK